LRNIILWGESTTAQPVKLYYAYSIFPLEKKVLTFIAFKL